MKTKNRFPRTILAVAMMVVAISFSACQKEESCNPATPSVNENMMARGGVVFRPFSDFMDNQRRDYFAMATAYNPTGIQRFADVDYMGTLALSIADNGGAVIPTSIKGTLSEIQMPDGRAKVTVSMSVENALSIGSRWDNVNFVTEFGYDFLELSFDPTLKATTGWAKFKLVFYNSAMGAPIPNVAFDVPFEDFIEFNFHSSAKGFLRAASGYPEGTPATMKVDMVGLFKNKNHTIPRGTTADGFAVEHITYSFN